MVPEFHAYGPAHLTVIVSTIALPFVLAACVRCSKWRLGERLIAFAIAGILLVNYFFYLFYVRQLSGSTWKQSLPIQLCDWAAFVVVVAVLNKSLRWFEIAYFWGIGGTLQAILTPNLPIGFPDIRFISFFIAHSGVIIGIVFLMLIYGFRPRPMGIFRTIAWTEVYFVITFTVDLFTGENYGFLLHKPEAASLLSFLSDSRVPYLVEFHLVAWIFFALLYAPFAIVDLARGKSPGNARKPEGNL